MRLVNRTKNELWFFLSIFLAIILWVIVINVENPTESVTIRNVSIDVINEDSLSLDNIMYYGMEEKNLTVKIIGSKLEINKVKNLKDEIKGIVDLSKYNRYVKEDNTFDKYLPVTINIPTNLKTINLESQNIELIRVYVDEISEITKAVTYTISGNLEKDYYIKDDSIKLLPNNVTIIGPKKTIQKIKEVKIIIDITNDDNRMPIPVHVYDDKGEIIDNIRLSQDAVTVQYDIVKKKEVKLIADITNAISSDLNLIDIKMEPSTIIILGDEKMIDEFSNDLHVKVEINNKEGKYNTKEKIYLKEGIFEWNNIDEVLISYEIRK